MQFCHFLGVSPCPRPTASGNIETCLMETVIHPIICMLETWFTYQNIDTINVNLLIQNPCLQHAYYGMYDRFHEACHHLCHILPRLATCLIETTMSRSICMLETWFAYQQIHIDSVNILIYKPCLQHAYYGMYDRFCEACHHLCHILPCLATCLIDTTMSRSIYMLETWFAYEQIHIDSVNILIYKPCLQHAYYGMYDRFREACHHLCHIFAAQH